MARITPLLRIAALAATITSPAMAEDAVYASPQAALDAMINALNAADGSVIDVFGQGSADIVSSGDADEDAANRATVLSMYQEGYRFAPDEDGSVILILGDDDWPFPIPLDRTDQGWAFDLEAGAEEIALREIGLHEMDVIALLDAYIDVQAAYRLDDHDGDGVMEFARHIISSEGTRDGLFSEDELSFVGDLLARASAGGYSDGKKEYAAEPYLGYVYRILETQGSAAPGGEFDYVINDNMVAGHAMIAVPAYYGESGIQSFIVSENGQILEADLGPDTLEASAEITAYNPDDRWSLVE